MSINIKFFPAIIIALLAGFSSCKKEDKTFGDLTAPAKPVIDVQVAGKTASLPNGDGTGVVNVTVTAANTINYRIDFGDGSTPTTSTVNTMQHTYSHIGTKEITITAIASGKAGISSSASMVVSVLKNYKPTEALVTLLTNNGSKVWKIDSVAPGHIGVGPLATKTPDYYGAAPNEKVGLGLYDDEFTFNVAGNVFTHTTNGTLFGKKEVLKDFDPSITGAGDYTLTGPGAANYTESFSYDGDGTTEYLIFTAKGHMGLYVGSHKYEVLSKTDTQMWLRCLGWDNNAWYVRIKAK